MDFVESYNAIITLAALAVAAAALATTVVFLFEIRRMRSPYRRMARIYEKGGEAKALEELLKGVDENREFIKSNAAQIGILLERIEGCYRGIGLVKYNAFEDIGGMQSYSLCVLTGEKNGFILTNLAGRNSTRHYALAVEGGAPSRELSKEEREALDSALASIS